MTQLSPKIYSWTKNLFQMDIHHMFTILKLSLNKINTKVTKEDHNNLSWSTFHILSMFALLMVATYSFFLIFQILLLQYKFWISLHLI